MNFESANEQMINMLEEKLKESRKSGWYEGVTWALNILNSWRDDYGIRAIKTHLEEYSTEPPCIS